MRQHQVLPNWQEPKWPTQNPEWLFPAVLLLRPGLPPGLLHSPCHALPCSRHPLPRHGQRQTRGHILPEVSPPRQRRQFLPRSARYFHPELPRSSLIQGRPPAHYRQMTDLHLPESRLVPPLHRYQARSLRMLRVLSLQHRQHHRQPVLQPWPAPFAARPPQGDAVPPLQY